MDVSMMMKNMRTWIDARPMIKGIMGVTLVLIGIVALVTPLTPGSWLALIGLEFLGMRIILRDWALKQKALYVYKEDRES